MNGCKDVIQVKAGDVSFLVKRDEQEYFWGKVSKGKWEPETFLLLDCILDPDDIMVDVGAWIGPITLYAAKKCRKVISFEPDPVSFLTLEENVKLNSDIRGKTELFQCALVSEGKKATLFAPATHGWSSSGSSLLNYDPCDDPLLSVEVCGYPVEEFADNQEIQKAKLIRCDIEGGEYEVIYRLLKHTGPFFQHILVSLHPQFVESTGNTYQERLKTRFVKRPYLTNRLFKAFKGYRIYHVTRFGRVRAFLLELLSRFFCVPFCFDRELLFSKK